MVRKQFVPRCDRLEDRRPPADLTPPPPAPEIIEDTPILLGPETDAPRLQSWYEWGTSLAVGVAAGGGGLLK